MPLEMETGLTKDQIRRFERDGILVVEDFLTQDEVSSIKAACRELVRDMDPKVHRGVFSAKGDQNDKQTDDDYFMESNDKIRFFFETDAFDSNGELQMAKESSLNKMGHALHFLDPTFKRVTFSDKMKAVARSLDLKDPMVVQGMYIFKNPRIGGEVTPHQDGTFLRNDPLKLVGYWFPIDDATLENGCLWFVPGIAQESNHQADDPESSL